MFEKHRARKAPKPVIITRRSPVIKLKKRVVKDTKKPINLKSKKGKNGKTPNNKKRLQTPKKQSK
jgi:hypothetical protein